MIHYWPDGAGPLCDRTRTFTSGTSVPRRVTCEPCLAAMRDADERILLAEQPADMGVRWVRRIKAWRIRHDGGLRAARDAVMAQDWAEAQIEDRYRTACAIERRAARETGEWGALLADATAARRRLEAQLRLVRDAGGTPEPTAPVNAVGPFRGFAPDVWPNLVANPYARHDIQ